MKAVAIGVDIGGTNIKLGLVDTRGRVLARDTFLTGSAPGRPALMRRLVAHMEILRQTARQNQWKLTGVGIGAPGPIDVERGRIYFFPNIPGWKDTPLKALLEKRLKLPVYLDNDANVMALAEFLFGAGRGVQNIIALTLGTGVGGGIVVHGRLFHGPHYSAAEIGHLTINENGPRCACGSRGCIETYVGNGYFVRDVRQKLKAGRASVLKKWIKEGQELSPLLVKKAAQKGDTLAKEMWTQTGGHLGTALAGLVNILNPERIVIGGGVAQAGELLFRPIRETIRKKAFPIAYRSVKVVPAVLGTDAGLIGAAALVLAPARKRENAHQ